jgi:hypothetical protein
VRPRDARAGIIALSVTKKGRRNRNEELRGVLNSGHRKATARAIRHYGSKGRWRERRGACCRRADGK